MIPKGNLHATETTVIDGIEYETIELGSDFAQNKSKVKTDPNGNYRYVMTADFDMQWKGTLGNSIQERRINFYGASVIFDLNGYTVTMNGWGINSDNKVVAFSYFIPYCDELKIMDSSDMQNGRIVSNGAISFYGDACKSIIVSGGNGDLFSGGSGEKVIVTINGGNYKIRYFNHLLVAPYLQSSDEGNGLYHVKPYDAYAVSTSNLVSGMYNTVYGLAWDLDLRGLLNLTVPTDKTYYLWARNAEDKYQFLNLRCTDGKTWQQ